MLEVSGKDGFRARLVAAPAQGEPWARLVLEDGHLMLVPTEMLTRDENGDYRVPLSGGRAAEPTVYPILHEEVVVNREPRERGRVRLTKTVKHDRQTVRDKCLHESIEIQTVPVNQLVAEPPPVRHEGDLTVYPLVEEVLVVEKRLMLREEIHVRRKREELERVQDVVLRREEVEIHRRAVNLPG